MFSAVRDFSTTIRSYEPKFKPVLYHDGSFLFLVFSSSHYSNKVSDFTYANSDLSKINIFADFSSECW